MLNHSFTLPSILIGTVATIAIVQTVAVSLSPTEIHQVAKQFVVRINGSEWMSKGNGSGSIIGKNGNTYQVLTNRHVVSESENINDYTIQTVDNQTHRVLKIEPLKGADLAIITFESRNQYRVAKLGNSEKLTEGQAIHFAGYPADTFRSYRFYSNESINGFLPAANAEDGYEIIFTGAIVPGMSGSPLLNNDGEIIGIYGRGELGGILYGIRINTAIKLAQENGIIIAKVSSPSQLPQTTISVSYEYTKLQDLLAAQRWEAANEETTTVMLKMAQQEEQGGLTANDINEFPCDTLRTIDQLWLHYSKGKFGFSVQNNIYQSVGGTTEYEPEIMDDWIEEIGWKKGEDELTLSSLTFDITAPQGHLPTGPDLGMIHPQTNSFWVCVTVYCEPESFVFLQRVESCKVAQTKPPRQRLTAIDYYDKGKTLSGRSNYKEAIEAYTQAIQLNPAFALAYNDRGTAYFNLRNYQRAITDYSKAIQLDPNYVIAYSNRGVAQAELGNYQKAVSDLTQAIRLNPDAVNTYISRGTVYSDLEDYQKAISDYNQAIRLDPNNGEAYANRGYAYYKLKQKQKAITDFQKAAKLFREQGNLEDYNNALNVIKRLQ